MDTTYDVAIVGTGRPHGTEGATGWGMSHAHARGYAATGRCRLVAVCDIVPDKARKFSDEHAGGEAAVFADYREMLAEVKPGYRVGVHVAAPARADGDRLRGGGGGAGGALREADGPDLGRGPGDGRGLQGAGRPAHLQPPEAVPAGVRGGSAARPGRRDRRSRPARRAPARTSSTGAPTGSTCSASSTKKVPAEWVIATVDARRPVVVYGVPMETQGVAQIRYGNGVHGLLLTGTSQDAVGCQIRALGSEGILELHGQPPHVRLKGGRGGRRGTRC
jgi:predicted dehydrogenase